MPSRSPSIIKDPQQEAFAFVKRAFSALIFSLVIVIILFIRLFYLQVHEHNRYTTLSNDNRVALLPIEPKRGLIFDRDGELLAENVPTYSLDIEPEQVDDLEQTLTNLSEIIPFTEEEKKAFYHRLHQKRRMEAIPLVYKLTPEQVAQFSVNRYKFKGVEINARLIRHYPQHALFAHVLGYVGRINEHELNKLDPGNYSATEFIGKLGIERFYEPGLHGTVGHQRVEANAQGKVIRVLRHTPPQPGNNIYLTIQLNLQKKAMELLKGHRGAIVALNPQNGEVLALASNPSYDPEPFVTGIDQASYHQLNTNPDQPLFNRAIKGQYAPASTIKPLMALKGLDTGLITPEEKIYDEGSFKLKADGHQYRCWKPHGWVNLSRSLYESCDTYYYRLANKLQIDNIRDILRQFGFGEITGIDIKEEVAGLVPSPAWKRKTFHQGWYTGETLITGIGQSYLLATPLQLASAIATIANHGVHYQPHLLMAQQTNEGALRMFMPKEQPPVALNQPKHWDRVIQALVQVIENPNGTAHRMAAGLKYKIAGKTGTTQVFSLKEKHYNEQALEEHLRDHSWFIGFAPVNNPKIAVAIIVENAPKAVKTSTMARKIMDQYLLKAPT